MPAPPYPALCPGPVGVCVGLHWLVRFPPPEMSWSKIEIITKIANYDFSGVNCTKSWKKCVKSSVVTFTCIWAWLGHVFNCFLLLFDLICLALLSFDCFVCFLGVLWMTPMRCTRFYTVESHSRAAERRNTFFHVLFHSLFILFMYLTVVEWKWCFIFERAQTKCRNITHQSEMKSCYVKHSSTVYLI